MAFPIVSFLLLLLCFCIISRMGLLRTAPGTLKNDPDAAYFGVVVALAILVFLWMLPTAALAWAYYLGFIA